MERGVTSVGYGRRAAMRGSHLRTCVFLAVAWVVLGILFALGALYVCLRVGVVLAPLWAFAVTVLGLIVFVTARYFRLEYDYEVEDGQFTVAKIYGRQYRYVKATLDLRNADVLIPWDENAARRLEKERPAVRHDLLSSADSDEAYLLLYTDNRGRRTALLFDAAEPFLKAARFYCPAALYRSASRV